MNPVMNLFIRPLILITCAFCISCTSNDAPRETSSAPASTKLPQPFRYHRAVEVKPGLTFDVLSWGRGSEYVGAYMILRSDSGESKYQSTTGELEGEITDVWNMDMDADGNPEIFIQAKGQDEDTYLQMYIHEFSEGGSSQKIRFPDLSNQTKKSYRGKDSIYIKDGELFRMFPVYDNLDTAAQKPIGKKVLEYSLRGNNFSVKELKDDSSSN